MEESLPTVAVKEIQENPDHLSDMDLENSTEELGR